MYDLIIIGAGPAGLSAAIYAARYKLKVLVLCKELGGLIVDAWKVENYPGFKEISGLELMNKFKEQAEALGVKTEQGDVHSVSKKSRGFVVKDLRNKSYEAKAVILALGTKKRSLNVEGEEKFLGKGVSYCAVCDAPLFKDKVVGVVGGSNSCCMSSLLLAEYAKKVYVIYRKEKLRGDPLIVEKINKNKKIEVINNAEVTRINGSKFVESADLDTGKNLKLDGLFVEIGSIPPAVLMKDLGVKTDKNGYVVVDNDQKTNVKGVFAAGDITTKSANLKQVVTAAAEGAVAAIAAYNYLKNKE